MKDILTEKLDSLLAMGTPFYDCIVLKDGQCVYRHGNGFVDPERTQRVTGKEKLNFYSCSKLITCVAALQLYEKGLYDLDDELYRYLPEFENMTVRTPDGTVPAKSKITVRQLFTMTAGFGYDIKLPSLYQCKLDTDGRCPTREAMKYLAKEPLYSHPGEKWRYSLCHDVLAAVVEVISGMEFNEYLKRNIFDVCGMNNTTFLFPEERAEEMTQQYRRLNGETVPEINLCSNFGYGCPPYRLGTEYASGGAGAVSTLDDYILFLEAVRTYKLLKEETVELLEKNQLTEEQMQGDEYIVNGGRGWSLGQACPSVHTPDRTDFGWGSAAGNYYCIDRKNKLTVLYCSHILGYEEYQTARTAVTMVAKEMFCR